MTSVAKTQKSKLKSQAALFGTALGLEPYQYAC
jgi:hypothetical protein